MDILGNIVEGLSALITILAPNQHMWHFISPIVDRVSLGVFFWNPVTQERTVIFLHCELFFLEHRIFFLIAMVGNSFFFFAFFSWVNLRKSTFSISYFLVN